MAIESQAIIVGQTAKVQDAERPDHGFLIVHFKVQETLKGKPGGDSVQVYLPLLEKKEFADWVASGEDRLLFLKKAEEGSGVPKGEWKIIKWQQAEIPNAKFQDLFNKDGEELKDKKKALATIREWSSSKIVHSMRIEVPMSSKVWTKLYAGSGVYEEVPAEEKFREGLMKMAQSKEAYEREMAAADLFKFPGEKTVAILKGLTKDATENFAFYSADTITSVDYRVRAAACGSLALLGEKVPEMTLERKPTAEEQRAAREGYWKKGFAEALPKGWEITVTDGQARSIEKREWTAVVVSLKNGSAACKLMLVPKEWPKEAHPSGVYLGIDGPDAQGGRHFFLDGDLPDEVKGKVIKYFGLQAGQDPSK